MFNLHITQVNQHHEHIFLEQTEMIDNFYFTPLVGATSANQHHKNIFLEQTDMINNFYFTPLVGATWADQHHTEFMFNPPRRVSGQRSSLLFSDRRQLHLSKSAVSKYRCFLYSCGSLSLLFSLSSKHLWLIFPPSLLILEKMWNWEVFQYQFAVTPGERCQFRHASLSKFPGIAPWQQRGCLL